MMTRKISGLFQRSSSRRDSDSEEKKVARSTSLRWRIGRRSAKQSAKQTIRVTRAPDGRLGFDLEGCVHYGTDAPGVFVCRATSKCPLKDGSRILEVNGIDVQNGTVSAVKRHLEGDDASVTITVSMMPARASLSTIGSPEAEVDKVEKIAHRNMRGNVSLPRGTSSDPYCSRTSYERTSSFSKDLHRPRSHSWQSQKRPAHGGAYDDADINLLVCKTPLRLSREEAEEILKTKEPGTYILRQTTGLRLSVMTLDGPRHLVIYSPHADEYFLFPEQRFPSLFDLISHHRFVRALPQCAKKKGLTQEHERVRLFTRASDTLPRPLAWDEGPAQTIAQSLCLCNPLCEKIT